MRKSALYALGLVVAALVALGLVILSSASEVRGARFYHDSFFFVKRQFLYLGAGIVIAAALALFDYRKWRDYWGLSAVFAAMVFVALLAVFLFPEIKGSHRWIVLGPLSFQPGEFAKIAVVIVVAVWLDLAAWRVELFWRGALWPVVLIGMLAGPVALEPDFGSVMVIASVGFLLMFVAGTRILHMAPLFLCGLVVVGVMIYNNPNRRARIAKYVGAVMSERVEEAQDDESQAEAQDASGAKAAAGRAKGKPKGESVYQSEMSLVAIGRGGLFGVGLSRSMQKQNYLPEAWTDFIFAVGAEELGLVFSVSVILLFAAFFFLSVYIARTAADRFGRLLVVGMAFIVFFQAMFNLGVVCEAFPTKGMALPFFSYGGTNMLSSFFAVGVILSVGIHSLKDQKRTFTRKVLAN